MEIEADPLEGTPYRALAVIGRGATGSVLDAEHRVLRRRVVVKVLHARHAGDPNLVERMRVEAQAFAAIAHPNVVAVSDFGQTPDVLPYFVMERLVGQTLVDELKQRGHLSPEEVVEFGRQLLSGLSAIHAIGLVHRDIKPANLFLCEGPHKKRALKILDLGIAKVLSSSGGRVDPLQHPTQEGMGIGTPRFFSPEQSYARPVDHRSDLYSVGAVLYALLVGRDPFHHCRSQFAVMRAHATETPRPPSRSAPQLIPPELDRVLLRALEKKPDDRFQSCAELSDALTAALRPTPPIAFITEPMATSVFRRPDAAPVKAKAALSPVGVGARRRRSVHLWARLAWIATAALLLGALSALVGVALR